MVHKHHDAATIPGEIPIPHGPPDSDDPDEPMAHGTAAERRIFSHVTRPDDSYTEDGVYWADLPLVQRMRFVSKVDNQAAKQEAK
ncbi:inorganic phosphate permease, partial [Fusarium albosuccineum]